MVVFDFWFGERKDQFYFVVVWLHIEDSTKAMAIYLFIFLDKGVEAKITKIRMDGLYFGAEVMWENWPRINEREFLNCSDTM